MIWTLLLFGVFAVALLGLVWHLAHEDDDWLDWDDDFNGR